MEEDYKYHTRNRIGVINWYDNIDDALTDFLSYDGYRLGIESNGDTVYFFRDELPNLPNFKPGSLGYENPSKDIEYNSKVLLQRGK